MLARPYLAQPTCVGRSELQRPAPYGLVTDIDATFRQQILNISDHWYELTVPERGIRFYLMFELFERGVDAVVGEVIDRAWDGTDAQYLGFNLNVMNASMAPGGTAAEPGGLESREMMRIAGALGRRSRVCVIEVCELCPIFDVSDTTSRLAVCVVLRILAAMAQSRVELVDQTIERPSSD